MVNQSHHVSPFKTLQKTYFSCFSYLPLSHVLFLPPRKKVPDSLIQLFGGFCYLSFTLYTAVRRFFYIFSPAHLLFPHYHSLPNALNLSPYHFSFYPLYALNSLPDYSYPLFICAVPLRSFLTLFLKYFVRISAQAKNALYSNITIP